MNKKSFFKLVNIIAISLVLSFLTNASFAKNLVYSQGYLVDNVSYSTANVNENDPTINKRENHNYKDANKEKNKKDDQVKINKPVKDAACASCGGKNF